MKIDFNNPDTIESYIKGNLNEADRVEFEEKLRQDPLLKNEIELQKDIINSLKSYRKAELKARLDVIKPGGVFETALVSKIAASILIAASLGVGAYFLFQPEAVVTSGEKPVVEAAKTVESQSGVSKSKESSSIPEAKEIEAEKTEKVIAATKSEKKKEAAPVVIEEENTDVITPNLRDNFSENDLNVKSNAGKTPMPMSKSVESKESSDIEIVTEKEKSETLSYKYYNHKLFLYGDFKSTPYELLELTTAEGKKLFLFFNNVYYKVDDNQMDITPLITIKDPSLLKELDSLRRTEE